MTELYQPKDNSRRDENEGSVNRIQQPRPSSLLSSHNLPSVLECPHVELEFDRQTERDDDERLLKRDPNFVDVETFFHVFWRGANSCHSSTNDLNHETYEAEENETGSEGSSFDFEDAVRGDVEVDHPAENHVAECIHPLKLVSKKWSYAWSLEIDLQYGASKIASCETINSPEVCWFLALSARKMNPIISQNRPTQITQQYACWNSRQRMDIASCVA